MHQGKEDRVLWLKSLNIRRDDGAFVVVGGVTATQGAQEGCVQGEGMQVFLLQEEMRSTQCNNQIPYLQY
jgi:hypothetical protein